MVPVAASLDILQGQQQCALGIILPTLIVLKKQLIALQVTSVEPLVPLPTSLLVQKALKTFSEKTILAVKKTKIEEQHALRFKFKFI